MTKRDIATLSFKVLSIYALIRAIDKLSDIFYINFQGYDNKTIILNLALISVPLILLVICSLLLWFFAPLLANSIFKSIIPEDKSDASLENIQRIAFSIVGLYLIASGLPELVNMVTIFVTPLMTSVPVRGGLSPMINLSIVFILKIALGLWLLLGSRGLINFIRSTRRD